MERHGGEGMKRNRAWRRARDQRRAGRLSAVLKDTAPVDITMTVGEYLRKSGGTMLAPTSNSGWRARGS